MFTSYHLPHLIRYFDGIDRVISSKLGRRNPPDETTLTDEFCAIMDAENQRRERLIEFDLDALTTALTAHGDMIDVQFVVETHQHPKWMEAYVSQSDFALIIEYDNMVLPEYSWYTAYLMQAKRMFTETKEGYGLRSKFSSTDSEQHNRIHDLVGILGENAVKYCLYCPPTYGYMEKESAAVRAIHAIQLSKRIFDFAEGLALHDAIKKSGGLENGIWITGTSPEPSDASSLHRGAFEHSHPLTWFLIQHMGSDGRVLEYAANRLNQVSGWSSSPVWKAMKTHPSPQIDRVRAIAACDSQTIKILIKELSKEARKPDLVPERRKVLPASTVRIKIRVGPPD
jgi:hypothetical protein